MILDSGYTISILKDTSLVENVRETKNKLMLYTNAGKMVVNQEADVPAYGRVFFNDKAITNLFSMKDLIQKGRVEFDSAIENAFRIMVGGKSMKFIADEKGLYILEYKKMENYNQIKGFSHREVEKAKRTRRLYHQLAAPSVVAFKSLLRQNLIKNCDVTEKDITLTENIFGTDVPTLKGKSTRPKPRTVVDEEIEIPKEFISKNKNLELAMDIVFINSETLLTTVDRSILFKSCIPLP